MIVVSRIEQTPNEEMSIEYLPKKDKFIKSKFFSLLYKRAFKYYYGWITGTGTPPGKHLDIYIITERSLNLGEMVETKIIGVFKRNDGDHKIISVEKDSVINTFSELPENQINNLKGIYPVINIGEGWFERVEGEKIYQEFKKL